MLIKGEGGDHEFEVYVKLIVASDVTKKLTILMKQKLTGKCKLTLGIICEHIRLSGGNINC